MAVVKEKTLEEVKADFFKEQKKTKREDITVSNNGPFEGKNCDGWKVVFKSNEKSVRIVYDSEKIAYEKAAQFCSWK